MNDHSMQPGRRGSLGVTLKLTAAAVFAAFGQANVYGFQFDTGDSGVAVRLDTTVKYSAATRLRSASAALSTSAPAAPNQNDGNNNFGRGLVSNRLDLLTEFDVVARNYGVRVSAAAWYDDVYNRSTDNRSLTSNADRSDRFPSQTRRIMGRDAELLDAFVFGRFDVADRQVNLRLGRHTLLWGESLFYGMNGIAGGQAPTDIVKLQSVPNSLTKETARPTGKLSGSLQLSDTLSLGAYVGYEWEPTRLQPAGAYLSTSDILGPEGGQRLLVGPASVTRQPELEPKDSGQYGAQVRWYAEDLDTDFGLYAIRYHATTPSNVWTTLSGMPPALAPVNYRWVYHEGVRAYGFSAAKAVGEWSLGAELSMRENAPLASVGQSIIPAIGAGTGFDNKSNPGYAVGKTLHAQLSWIASLGPTALYREASFMGEVAWNRRMSVSKNEQMLNPLADRDATAMRLVFSPTYRQVSPGLDISVPVGLSYAVGRSSALGPAFGVHKGGDFNIGVQGTYLNRYFFTVSYVNYYGPQGPSANAANQAQFKQALKDRDFISVSFRTTF